MSTRVLGVADAREGLEGALDVGEVRDDVHHQDHVEGSAELSQEAPGPAPSPSKKWRCSPTWALRAAAMARAETSTPTP